MVKKLRMPSNHSSDTLTIMSASRLLRMLAKLTVRAMMFLTHYLTNLSRHCSCVWSRRTKITVIVKLAVWTWVVVYIEFDNF